MTGFEAVAKISTLLAKLIERAKDRQTTLLVQQIQSLQQQIIADNSQLRFENSELKAENSKLKQEIVRLGSDKPKKRIIHSELLLMK